MREEPQVTTVGPAVERAGLSASEVQRRQATDGPNLVASPTAKVQAAPVPEPADTPSRRLTLLGAAGTVTWSRFPSDLDEDGRRHSAGGEAHMCMLQPGVVADERHHVLVVRSHVDGCTDDRTIAVNRRRMPGMEVERPRLDRAPTRPGPAGLARDGACCDRMPWARCHVPLPLC
jgi:hypothetical protein